MQVEEANDHQVLLIQRDVHLVLYTENCPVRVIAGRHLPVPTQLRTGLLALQK